jgi:hypothetical protein
LEIPYAPLAAKGRWACCELMAARRHAGREPLPQDERCVEVHRHRGVPGVLVEFGHRWAEVDPRRVHEDVDGPCGVGERVGSGA